MNRNQKIISVAALALAALIFLGILTGGPILDLLSGAAAITDDAPLNQAENEYIFYEVTCPVAAYTEEYYAGDPNRASLTAYVVYDEKRQVFLKIVVASHNTGSLNRLLKNASLPGGGKESSGSNPGSLRDSVTVSGTLMAITDSDDINMLLSTMQSADSKTTDAMNAEAFAQVNWYELRDGYVQGLPAWEIWIAFAVAGINLLFLFISLILLLRKGTDEDSLKETSGSYMGQFLKSQLPFLAPWCQKGAARRTQTAFLVLAGSIVAAVVLGFFTGRALSDTLTALVPLFFGMGELYSFPLLLGAGTDFNPYKLLQNYGKALKNLYPVETERETALQNLLEADDSWVVHEQGKEACTRAILGSRYWIVLGGDGRVTLLDSERIGRMNSGTVSGQVRSGKVRYHYTSYVIYVYYQGEEENKHASVQFGWNSENASGHFMALARKRLGERAQAVMR